MTSRQDKVLNTISKLKTILCLLHSAFWICSYGLLWACACKLKDPMFQMRKHKFDDQSMQLSLAATIICSCYKLLSSDKSVVLAIRSLASKLWW